MSTASLAISGTQTAGGGRLADRGLWLVGRGYFEHFIFRQRDRVITPRFDVA